MSSRPDLELAQGSADQTLDEDYPFPDEHAWWRVQAERHARAALARLEDS